MKLLFADRYPAAQIEVLEAAGHECLLRPELTADDLPQVVGGVEVLVVRSTHVPEQVLDAADELRLIIRAGSGTNTIAVAEATNRGIQVSNVPGRNAIAVAELAMGLILSIDRNIPDNVIELRAGNWDKVRFSGGTGLFGRRLGIVGLGNTGLALAERARAFGMAVVGENKNRPADSAARIAAAGIELVPDLEALLSSCDVVSLHVPYNGVAVVDAEFLTHVRPGAILINTSRGEIIDEEALVEAMDAKGIRAGLDVYLGEPSSTGVFVSAVAQHPNVYGTHHIGASTAQAQNAVANEVIEIIDAFGRGEALHQVGV